MIRQYHHFFSYIESYDLDSTDDFPNVPFPIEYYSTSRGDRRLLLLGGIIYAWPECQSIRPLNDTSREQIGRFVVCSPLHFAEIPALRSKGIERTPDSSDYQAGT